MWGREMKKILTIVICMMCCLNVYATSSVNVATLATAEAEAIMSNPMGNFLNYKIKGVCTWLTEVYPFIHVTLYVQHYLPDTVVSVYPKLGENPFTEANSTIDPTLASMGQAEMNSIMGQKGGTGSFESSDNYSVNKFYEVDVIGNPGAFADSAIFALGLVPPATTPYVPYYSSQLDMYLWHNPALEIALHPSSYIPFMNNEGSKLAPWGSLYPRYGMIVQNSDYKAAAMIALRAVHLATRSNQSHVYKSEPKNCGKRCTVIKDPDINDNDSVEFQLVSPQIDTTFDKDDFGHNDINAQELLDTYKQKIATKGDNAFVWLAWRKYEGCVQHPGTLLAVIKY
jgi:integrating conjugative element protein (TIGR03756 family)